MIINPRANRGPYLDPGEFKELDASLEIPGDRMASTGDVLVNSLGEGTLGRTHLFLGEDRVLAVDQHITICRPKANAAAYVYLTLSSREGQARIAALKTGSTGMTMLNISRLRSLQVLAPPNEVLDAFARVSLPLLSIAATSEQESRTLTAMRNALLPRLFGGRMPPGEAGMEASASDECRRLLHESLVELSCLEDVIGNPGVPLT
jgi:type I restriction enzyme S subunit